MQPPSGHGIVVKPWSIGRREPRRQPKAAPPEEALLDRNVALFIAYRLLFNLRFYYPVFALFYLDAGITLEQFGWLQGLWSLSIIACEVPSGIIADLIGRRKTLRLGAFLAVVEMIVFACSSGVLGFAVNRVLSGFNESLVSGADSALLYDTLKSRGREVEYKEVLGRAQFYSLTFGAVATISGSYLYSLDIRLPIWATAGCMVLTFGCALLLFEPPREALSVGLSSQWRMLTRSLADILADPQLLFLIALVFVADSSVRLVLVHNSLYYQAITIPVVWFGVVGVGVRLFSSLCSKYAYRVDRLLGFGWSMAAAFTIMLLAFIGLSWMVPWYGMVFVALLTAGMVFVSLLAEGEINQRIASERRATILSLKSITLNIGFGLGMPIFAALARTDLAVGFRYLAVVFGLLGLALLAGGRRWWSGAA